MLNVRIVNLDFGDVEVYYASQVQLVDNMLLLPGHLEAKAKKDFVKELRGKANEKGVIDYGRDMPHVYRFRSRKTNIFVGSDINTAIEHIAKHKLEEVRVTFEVTSVKDGEEHKTEVSQNFMFPASEDRDEIRDRLFRNNDFIYQQGSWYSHIIGVLVEEKEECKKDLEEQSEENQLLLCDLNLLRTYVKDMSSVLTPDIPQEVFADTWDTDDKGMLVIQALTSVSKKVAELAVASEKKDELPITSGKVKEAFEEANQKAVDLDSALNQKHGLIQLNPRFSFARAHATLAGSAKSQHYVSEQLRQAKEK